MSAATHLLQRLRRRIGLHLLRARAAQLELAICEAELLICETHDDLAVLRNALNMARARLRMAHAHPSPAPEAPCH